MHICEFPLDRLTDKSNFHYTEQLPTTESTMDEWCPHFPVNRRTVKSSLGSPVSRDVTQWTVLYHSKLGSPPFSASSVFSSLGYTLWFSGLLCRVLCKYCSWGWQWNHLYLPPAYLNYCPLSAIMGCAFIMSLVIIVYHNWNYWPALTNNYRCALALVSK